MIHVLRKRPHQHPSLYHNFEYISVPFYVFLDNTIVCLAFSSYRFFSFYKQVEVSSSNSEAVDLDLDLDLDLDPVTRVQKECFFFFSSKFFQLQFLFQI